MFCILNFTLFFSLFTLATLFTSSVSFVLLRLFLPFSFPFCVSAPKVNFKGKWFIFPASSTHISPVSLLCCSPLPAQTKPLLIFLAAMSRRPLYPFISQRAFLDMVATTPLILINFEPRNVLCQSLFPSHVIVFYFPWLTR